MIYFENELGNFGQAMAVPAVIAPDGRAVIKCIENFEAILTNHLAQTFMIA